MSHVPTSYEETFETGIFKQKLAETLQNSLIKKKKHNHLAEISPKLPKLVKTFKLVFNSRILPSKLSRYAETNTTSEASSELVKLH